MLGAMHVLELAGLPESPAIIAAHAATDPDAPEDYRQLAALLVSDWRSRRPRWVGLSGGQGAGKSTLAHLVVEAGTAIGFRIAVLSLDDFYLDRAARSALAARVHPLLETRGPPGTHDVEGCEGAMCALLERGEVGVPVFDKGLDDRAGSRRLRGPFDLVMLEGWCVGARPVERVDLEEPINALESERDPDGRWRRFVNDQLAGAYRQLWDALDELVFLRAPEMAAIRRWRLQQEESRSPEQRLSSEEVVRFVQYFERVTLAMARDLPERAKVIVELDDAHRVTGLTLR